MADGLTARNGTETVRQRQRALSRTSKQDKERRFYSLDDKVWRTAILWEAWRQVKANKGAPGGDGKAIDERVETGQDAGTIKKRQEALRAKRYRGAPVRVVEIPQPKGGTRRLGSATGEDRMVQTAMQLVLEPICEADVHDGSYGYRPKRDAQQAAMAIREDLDNRAWGVAERDFKAYCTSIPPGKLLKLRTKRMADGRRLKRSKQTRNVGLKDQGPVVPTPGGVPPGSPISPWYSNIYLGVPQESSAGAGGM